MAQTATIDITVICDFPAAPTSVEPSGFDAVFLKYLVPGARGASSAY